MDLDTSAFVAEVNSSSLLKSKLDQNINFLENGNISYPPTNDDVFEDENGYLEQDYLIASPDISPNNNICDSSNSRPDSTVELTADLNFNTARLNDIENHSEYFADSTLEVNQYCINDEYSSVDDIVVNKNCGQIPLNRADICNDNDVPKYQNVVSSASSTPSELINPESILEASSQLLDEQDKADFAALELDEYLTLTKDIEPHFIIGSFSNYNENLKHSLDENQIDPGDMGIENTWNEEFAVPSTSNFPLPLPAPPENSNFNDFSSCNNFESVEPDSYASDLEALFSTNEVDTDVTDPAAEEGVCGLRNLGNTCFMSTGIQCLAATKFLVRYFIKKLSIQELDESSLTMQFAELLQKMWSGQYSVVHPTKFKQALGAYYSQFKDCSQHDCQEFLALLLDALHQQLVSLPRKPFEDEQVFKFKESMDIGVDYLSSMDLHTKSDLNEYMNNNDDSAVSVDCITSTNAENSSMEVLVDSFSPKTDIEEAMSSTKTAENDDENEVTGSKLNYIEDILKEAKTSNVNVLVTETEANNEICFDSEKFPKKERRRNIAETNYYDIYANVTNAIQKNSSSYFDSEPNFGDNLDLKRIKVNHLSKEKNCLMENENYPGKSIEKNVRIENERKMKVLNVDMNPGKEENVMETEEDRDVVTEEVEMRTEDDSEEIVSQTSEEDMSADNLEAEKHWEKHIKNNKSVIFDSFQGQFKNTVVCSACNFKSITYEPFMYLSVPLPHAIEKQICVTFISATINPPTQYLVTLTKQDEVSKIKQQLMKLIIDKLKYPVVIGEVLDYHIAKILDDNHQIRYLDDVNRSIYAFEQFCLMPKDKSETDSCNVSSSSKEILNSVSETCTICLEEKESDIKRHKNCACILCDVCIQTYAQHQGDKTIKCPVCRNDLIPDKDLVPIEQTDMKPSMRLLNVPLVYRVDKTGDGNNNQKTVMLFGHPALLKLPNQISGAELYDAVSSLHPYKKPFKLLLVDGQGRHCSRCMFNQHCRGCVISPDGHISLRTDDTLAVTFAETVDEVHEVRHSSMTFQRAHKTLSLYDCVQAFSQSEILDEFNPWYCPRCEKNQCATKTLSVWRFPNYLIVYLKRFVFHECTSIKLEDKVMFPLHDFNFNKKKESSYDLYACVCHTGGVSVGHYIAYTQHPVTHEWHCFNDENVSKQKPQEEEYCNAYILFYKKRNAREEDD